VAKIINNQAAYSIVGTAAEDAEERLNGWGSPVDFREISYGYMIYDI